MIVRCPLPERELAFSGEIARHSGDKTVVYQEVQGQKLLMSLFEPPKDVQETSRPLLVLIHGGGWQGRKVFDDQADWAGDYLGFLGRYFADRGWLCASIDYRLMRENGQAAGFELIDLCQDCADAVAWLEAHASELRIDRSRTAVLGESAGGYLAAALTTLPMGDRAFFKAAVLVNAITDLSDPRWGRKVAESSAHPLLKGKSRAEAIERLSPVMHLTEGVCPTLLVHGEADTVVFPFHSLKYHDLLKAAGGDARLEWIEQTNHAFLLAEYMQEKGVSLRAASLAVQRIAQWLDETMGA